MKYRSILILALLGIIACYRAFSQPLDESNPYRFYLNGGIYMPHLSTDVRFDHEESGIGLPLNMENELAMPSKVNTFMLEGTIRMSSRWSLTGNWFTINRSGQNYITRRIEVADTAFQTGANVTSRLKTTFTSAAFQFAIVNDRRIQAGLSLGARILTADAYGKADYNGYIGEDHFKGTAPLPMPGLFVSAWPHRTVRVRYELQYFEAGVGDISGRIMENKATAVWYPLSYFGVGAGWSHTNYAIEGIPFDNGFTGKADHTLSGFSFFASARF
jgi:hypothetical protein